MSRKEKLYSSRTIRSENVDPNLRNGVLSAPEFISSREFEIRAFEQSQLNTKNASSSRIFQSLPRTLRRRTASHNVKRIPKRLRARALREMQSSGLSKKTSKRLTGRELHRLKMKKRLLQMASKLRELRASASARGTLKDQFQLLNQSLKAAKLNQHKRLNNVAGAVDRMAINSLCEKPTGGVKFASRQKLFTWTPNHIWHAKRFHMVKRWGYNIPLSPNQKCFRSASRSNKEGSLLFETSYYGHLVIDCSSSEATLATIREFTRYNGNVPLWLSEGQRAYNGWFYSNGVPSALISMCVDTASHKLILRFHPADFVDSFNCISLWAKPQEGVNVHDTRYALGSLELRGPLALASLSKVLHISKGANQIQSWRLCSQNNDSDIIENGTVFTFFVKDPRYWKQPVTAPHVDGDFHDSIKTINEQSSVFQLALSALLLAEGRLELYKDMSTLKLIERERSHRNPALPNILGKSEFPILIYKLQNGAWTAIMPWFWVQPLFTMLTKVKSLQPAGYRQMHQLNSEMMLPTYPYDYPFTAAGYQDHQLSIVTRQLAHEKLPASKRINYETTEGYLLPGCDWIYLRKWVYGLAVLESISKNSKGFEQFGEFNEEHNRIIRNHEDLALVVNATRQVNSKECPIVEFKALDPKHQAFVKGSFKPDVSKFPPLPVVQVAVIPVKRGHIRDNARIYVSGEIEQHLSLSGFITTASFNMKQGTVSAIGLISANYMNLDFVYVRNIGCTSRFACRLKVIQ